MALKFADSLRSDQIDCAATEAAPRHPRSEYARQVFSKLNHQIQFGTAHLIVIAQTGVRIMHQSSKPASRKARICGRKRESWRTPSSDSPRRVLYSLLANSCLTMVLQMTRLTSRGSGIGR